MRTGRIYRMETDIITRSNLKGRIVSVDYAKNKITIEWFKFYIAGNSANFNYTLSDFNNLVEKNIIQICDDLPAGNPNPLFKSK